MQVIFIAILGYELQLNLCVNSCFSVGRWKVAFPSVTHIVFFAIMTKSILAP
jgi:hypothetical protein